jgi:hypothetical protein
VYGPASSFRDRKPSAISSSSPHHKRPKVTVKVKVKVKGGSALHGAIQRRAPRGISSGTGSSLADEEQRRRVPIPQAWQTDHTTITAREKAASGAYPEFAEAPAKGTGPVHDDSTEQPAVGDVLYLVTSGAPAPEGIPALIERCLAAGWRVLVFSTPMGTRFFDSDELERLTGEPVRTEYRIPGTGKSAPPADVVLACPLTFNSVNKFAHGHADNFAVGLLCEMIGYGVPVVVVPHCKPQLAGHPAFTASVQTLREMGVRVLFDPAASYERRLPQWSDVLHALPIRAVPE